MTVALIAASLTAVILIGVIIIAVYLKRTRGTHASAQNEIEQLDSLAFGTPMDKGASGSPSSSGDVKVKSTRESVGKPSDKLARRFGALGVLAAAVFATLAGKLWSMQLLAKDEYSNEAENNLYTTVSTPAPRGCIYDRNGIALVNNRTSQTVLADSDVASNNDTLRRLSTLLGIPLGVIRQRAKDESTGAQNKRIIATDVRLRDIAFISEHADAFQGVSVESRTIRDYPFGALASHALGYTGSPTEDELAVVRKGRNIESTDTIGKSGLELHYDSILAGEKGQRRVMVDAKGNIVSVISETDPSKGSDIYLTLDANVQYVADKLLADLIAPQGVIGEGKGVSGSIVALDVTDGSVLAMASYPTYDPSYFTNGIPQDLWDVYNSEESHAPMLNRAINGQYAAASTFKAFTSMAGLHYGFADSESEWTCTGKWDGFGSGDIQRCWLKTGHGTLGLHEGIVHSCDTVFYEIAKAFYDHGPDGTGEISETALQEYLRLYNFGLPTGIDLNDESSGRLPTPEWKAEQWRNVPSEAMWRGGDYSNMIIGQGDVLVTPLQIAAAYGAIATGKIMKTHLIKEVRNGSDDVVMTAQTEVVAEPDVNEEHLAYVRESLHDMIAGNRDLREDFAARGIDAAGKSGTAEHTDRRDDAWFVAYAPYEDPKYVVACIIEQGNGGADTAGPLVAEVMGALMNGTGDNGAKRVAGSTGKSVKLEFSGNSGRND